LKRNVYTKSHSYHLSRTIHAPLRFVYDWCTDFRDSDPEIAPDILTIGSKNERKVLLKTKHRVVYVMSYKSQGKQKSAVDVVTLHPPKAWHLDFVGDEHDEVGDYLLTSLGPRKTKLDMTFTEHYKIRGAPTQAQDLKHTHEVWDKYIAALKKDYSRRKS